MTDHVSMNQKTEIDSWDEYMEAMILSWAYSSSMVESEAQAHGERRNQQLDLFDFGWGFIAAHLGSNLITQEQAAWLRAELRKRSRGEVIEHEAMQ